MAKIFISYRRNDNSAFTGRMYDRLVAHFGRQNVFKDVDDIPAGVHFGTYLQDKLRQCSAALIVIGPHWLDARTENGQRRLDDADDWVRIEIEQAIALGISLIPVLIEETPMPTVAELPETLRDLAQRQSLRVRNDPDFSHDMERVILAIDAAARQRRTGKLMNRTMRRNSIWAIPLVVVLVIAALVLGRLFTSSGHKSTSIASTTGTTTTSTSTMGTATATTTGTPTATSTPTTTPPIGWSVYPTKLTTNAINSIAMVSANDGWAVGGGGTILHYTGGKWIKDSSPTTDDLNSIYMLSANEGWAVGGDPASGSCYSTGTIIHFLNGKWYPSPSQGKELFGVSMVSANAGWAMGWCGTNLYYNGSQWNVFSDPSGFGYQQLWSVVAVSATEAWAGEDTGAILHCVSSGCITYQNGPPATGHTINSIVMLSVTTGWAVSKDGIILQYDGSSWSQYSIPTSNNLNSIAMVSATDGWIVGDGGVILRYTESTWSQVQPGLTSQNLNGIGMVPLSATDGWAVGDNGTILHYWGG